LGTIYFDSIERMDRVVLVERFQSGEHEAFDEIVRRCQGRVYNLAYRFTHNCEDACDISQEVVIKVFNSLDRLKDRSAFDAWLKRVTVNACMDYLRRRPNEQTLDDFSYSYMDCEYSVHPNESVEDSELSERAREAVEKHVRDCPDCAAEVKSLEKMRSLLRASAEIETPDEYWNMYWDRLETKLPNEPKQMTAALRMSSVFANLFQQPAALAKTVICILFLAFLLHTMSDHLVRTPPIHIPIHSTFRSMTAEEPASVAEEYEQKETLKTEPKSRRSRSLPLSDRSLGESGLSFKYDAPQIKSAAAKPASAPAPKLLLGDQKGFARDELATVQDEYVLAEKYFRNGEYLQAIPAYQNFITANTAANVQDDRTLKAVYQIGEAHYQMKNYSDALSNFIAVTDAEGLGHDARKRQDKLSKDKHGMARLETLAASQPSEAVFETRVKLVSQAIFRQAESYEHLGRQQKALTSYRKYMAEYPQGEYVSQAKEKADQIERAAENK